MTWLHFGRRSGPPQDTPGTAGPYSPTDIELSRALGGGPARSGMAVGPDSAMQSATVYSCVRVISEDVGSIPLHLYRRLPNGGRERATDHPLYSILNLEPNAWQTAAEWREMLQGHVELRGNAYAKITRYGAGAFREVRELVPLHPARMQVSQDDRWRVTYKYEGKEIPASDILHIHGLSSDGVRGVAPVTLLRESIGLEMAAERHGALQFGNGARPGGVLEHPQTMSEEAAKRLKKQVMEASSGDNQHKLVLLEEGMKWHQVGLSNEDSQFIETRKLSRSVIAGAFRIPPHLIGDLERATFTNIEHQGIEYVTRTLMGRLVRWQQRLNKALLNPVERREFYFEFDPNALLRGDVKARFDAYNQGIQSGWLSRNEVREMENRNPADGLDDYLVPLNMGGAGDEEE